MLILAGVVIGAVVVVALPLLVLVWLYDLRQLGRRQVELLERQGRHEGWLPPVTTKR